MMSITSTKTVRGQYARSENTRTRILEAALVEAGKSGFQHTSVANIAARAGVATGILNYHFGTKRELLRELMASQMGDFLSQLHLPTEREDFFTYEFSIISAYLNFVQANPNYVRLSEEIRLHDPKLYQQGMTEHVKHITERLHRGIRRGDLKAISHEEIHARSFFILGTLTFLDRYIEDEHFPGTVLAARYYINSLRGGLAA